MARKFKHLRGAVIDDAVISSWESSGTDGFHMSSAWVTAGVVMIVPALPPVHTGDGWYWSVDDDDTGKTIVDGLADTFAAAKAEAETAAMRVLGIRRARAIVH